MKRDAPSAALVSRKVTPVGLCLSVGLNGQRYGRKLIPENGSSAHRVRPHPPPTGRPLAPSLSSCAPLEGTGFEPAVPLLRKFCRAVNPDAVMKTEAPKVRS